MHNATYYSVSKTSFKYNRYELEHKVSNISFQAGKLINYANRLTDTVSNFVSANSTNLASRFKESAVNSVNHIGADIVSFFFDEENAMTTNKAKTVLVKGDHIRILLYDKKSGYAFYHHGLYGGDGVVYEYNGRYPSEDMYTIEKCSLESFARGKKIFIDNRERPLYSPDEIIARAESRVGEKFYGLYANNCENYVTWCRCGAPLLLS